jgi:hypothetical protein
MSSRNMPGSMPMQQPPDDGLMQIQQAPQEPQASGTKMTGYCGPEDGPFECENCTYYQDPGQCSNPQVQRDPQVRGKVDPEGCCNLFSSAGNGENESKEIGEPEGDYGMEGQESEPETGGL